MGQTGRSTKTSEEYVTVRQAADRMKLSVSTVRSMCNDGVLPGAVRSRPNSPWRIPSKAVDAWRRSQSMATPVMDDHEATHAENVGSSEASPQEVGAPQLWQRFRNNPLVFYPYLLLSGCLVLAGVLFGLVSAGADFLPFSRQVRQWSLVREFPAEREGEKLIVVAQFYTSEGVVDTEIHNEIRDAIKSAAIQIGEPSLRVEVAPVRIAADNRHRANKLGQQYDASVVIWGADTNVRVTVNFLDLTQHDFTVDHAQLSDTERTQLANPNEFASFITSDLPSQLTFLSLYAIGRSYSIHGEHENGIKVLERAIAYAPEAEESPSLADTYFQLGWLYQIQGDGERAIERYTSAIARQADHAFAYNNRGAQRQYQGDLTGAIADYSEAVKLQPDMVAAYYNRAGAKKETGDLLSAIADYDRAIELQPSYADAYHNRGYLRQDTDDLTGAISDFTKAIELQPDYVSAYNNRGTARGTAGDLSGAIADFTKAIQLRPDYVCAYVNRAYVRMVQGDLNGSAADYSTAIQLEPDNPVVHVSRGTVRNAIGDRAGAIADFTRAIQLQPTLASAYSSRGVILADQGHLGLAIADLSKVIELQPTDAQAYYNRGTTFKDQGDLLSALTDLSRAIELQPNHYGAYTNRGIARAILGDMNGAITDFSSAISLKPDLSVAYYNRGRAYRAQGEYLLALKDLERYLQLHPSAPNRQEVEGWTDELRRSLPAD